VTKSLKEVAVLEDAIQRKQKQLQLQAERPDLQTMKTYQTIQKAQASLAVANSSATGEIEDDTMDTDFEIPPQSIIDTDSDGGLLGLKNNNFDDDADDADEDMYMPAGDNDSEEDDDNSDASVEQGKTSKKKDTKMSKVKILVIRQDFFFFFLCNLLSLRAMPYNSLTCKSVSYFFST
jgi:hypothetical protein